MMPDDWKDSIGRHDAIFFGAVGWPATVPDHVSLWGSLLQFRREFDQYVNLRPVRLMPGVPCPLADRKPGDIDFWSCARTPRASTPRSADACSPAPSAKCVMQETVITRIGVDRVLQVRVRARHASAEAST